MFYFNDKKKRKQIEFEIGNVLVGGQPGENRILAFGGIREITSENKEELEQYFKLQETISEASKISGSVDLFVREQKHIKERIDFVAEHTSRPFLIDLLPKDLELKKATLKYISEKGLQNRVIYNSLGFGTTEEEVELIREYGIKSAILLALDMADIGANGSLNLLEKKLFPLAEKAGIKNILIDTGAMPFNFGNVAAEAFRAIPVVKTLTRLPVGCASVNTAESYTHINKIKGKGYNEIISAFNSVALIMGADFLIYGPIRLVENLLPPLAAVNNLCAEANTKYFGVKSKR
jgi:tetrahydromethanopterin S-methyltransferase subunit H